MITTVIDIKNLLHRLWVALGDLLDRIVNPIVLGLFFFVLVTPVALMGCITLRDPLRIKTSAAASYWFKRFGELTGCPVIVITSFNVRGRAIVSTLVDAFRSSMRSDIDVLVVS